MCQCLKTSANQGLTSGQCVNAGGDLGALLPIRDIKKKMHTVEKGACLSDQSKMDLILFHTLFEANSGGEL